MFLQAAFEFVAAALDYVKVIIGEFTPLLLRLALAALFVLAVAQPFLQPKGGDSLPAGHRLIIVDDSSTDATPQIETAGVVPQIIVGEFAPLLLRLAFDFFPVSFDTVPVHRDLHINCARLKCPACKLNVEIARGFPLRRSKMMGLGQAAARGFVSKKSAWLTTAFTMSGMKGFVIRKAGSGF